MTDRSVTSSVQDKSLDQVKTCIHKQVVASLDLSAAAGMEHAELRRECLGRVQSLLAEQRRPIPAADRVRLIQEVMDDIFGLGPLEELLRDPTISDILVNGPHQVYIEREGRLAAVSARFRDNDHLLQIIHHIASRVGRRIDESSPMLDARLQDGSRVNAIIPPLALDGPALSIRRFGTCPLGTEALVRKGALAPEMARFLEAAVLCRLNIIISGGTGTGKTTLLNALSQWIPKSQRVVTIEDAAELRLLREHVVRLETRPPNIEGRGEVTQRDLLRNTLRMRPDRIVIGEARGAEALDMLQAMNTGHEGSMTTVHANSARDALGRVEIMVSMAGLNFPVQAIRQQIVSAIDILVHLSRMTGGQRRVTSISELSGMEGSTICLSELFKFSQTGIDSDGNADGYFEVCGVRPRVMADLEAEDVAFPPDFFHNRKLHANPGSENAANS